MIVIFSGLPGSGKSYKLGQTAVEVLYRNRKQGLGRKLYSNLQFSDEILAEFGEHIVMWTDLRELVKVRDADILMDEVGVYFDSRLWAELGQEIRRFLAQHRKLGIEIYGTAQDFAQVDKAFRRLTSDLLYLTKLAGSRDISSTMAPPKYIWGLCAVRHLDPVAYDEEKSKFANTGFPSFMWISRAGTQVFDTRAEIAFSEAVSMRHVQKRCEKPDCDFHKIVHV